MNKSFGNTSGNSSNNGILPQGLQSPKVKSENVLITEWLKALESTGEGERLQSYVRERLSVDSSWRKKIVSDLRGALNSQPMGAQIPLDDKSAEELVSYVKPNAMKAIPDSVKTDLELRIRQFAQSQGFVFD